MVSVRRIAGFVGVIAVSISSFVAIAASPAEALTAPGAPTNQSAVGLAKGKASVSWTAPVDDGGSAIIGYVVTPYDGYFPLVPRVFASTATTQTVTGLTDGIVYRFKIAATNVVGPGPTSRVTNPVITGDTPTAVHAVPGDRSATVSWKPPGAPAGPIIGYTVTPWVGFTPLVTRVYNSTATTQTLVGLNPRWAYRFRVTAITPISFGDSSKVSNQITPNPGPPTAPVVSLAIPGDRSATIAWLPPAFDGGRPITGYQVKEYVAHSGNLRDTFTFNNDTALTHTIPGLLNGATYTFTVAAINDVGVGPESAQSLPVMPRDLPDLPTIGLAVPGDSSASVSWIAPVDDGGTPVTGYEVTPYINGVAQSPQVFDSVLTTQTITGLTNGTTYTFTVAAINAVGTGAESLPTNPVTPIAIAGAPVITSATAGAGQALLSWTAPADGGSPITGYEVTPYVAGIAQTPVVFDDPATTQTVLGLFNGTTYTFTVAAINALGTGVASSPSAAVLPVTVPDPPAIASAVAGAAQVALSWTEPASDGGSAITGYTVTPYIAGVPQTPVVFDDTATAQTLLGLLNGTAYTFTVAATNAAGTGAPSALSSSVIPVAVPGAPTINSAVAGIGQVALSWSAPTDTGGSPVIGYRVTPTILGLPQTPQVFNSTSTSQTILGLLAGVTYQFTVAAINAVGTGPDSTLSSQATTARVPDPPVAVLAVPGNAKATVSWTAPASNGGAAITGYTVTPYIGTTAQTPRVFNTAATSQLITGLTNGTAYTFTVAATNGVGTGSQSLASLPVTPLVILG